MIKRGIQITDINEDWDILPENRNRMMVWAKGDSWKAVSSPDFYHGNEGTYSGNGAPFHYRIEGDVEPEVAGEHLKKAWEYGTEQVYQIIDNADDPARKIKNLDINDLSLVETVK